MWPLTRVRVAIRGGGDLGSGVAFRLHRAGFAVSIAERAMPLMVRRAVSFGSAAVDGSITVEGVTARLAADVPEILARHTNGEIPVIIDPDGLTLAEYDPLVLVDARMLKSDPGPQPVRPPLIIGLGPGFHAPHNCDVAIETSRGHNLGRIIYAGPTLAHTHQPGSVLGYREERVLRAPAVGRVTLLAEIGDNLEQGQPIARVGEVTVTAPFDGLLRGLINEGTQVTEGLKIGDLDPRGVREFCFTISDKSLAIGGGVLEAILSSPAVRAAVEGVAG